MSRILCVCSQLRLLRYCPVHLSLIPSAFLRSRPKSPNAYTTFQWNILQNAESCWEMLLRSWPNARNIRNFRNKNLTVWSNTIWHLATCCNMWQNVATGWQKVCNIAHNCIARCFVEMLRCPCWYLMPFSLILYEIVTFLYDTVDSNLSSLPLLPNVSISRTLNLLLSSITALVFRALWV